jgi:hypothetical protein
MLRKNDHVRRHGSPFEADGRTLVQKNPLTLIEDIIPPSQLRMYFDVSFGVGFPYFQTSIDTNHVEDIETTPDGRLGTTNASPPSRFDENYRYVSGGNGVDDDDTCTEFRRFCCRP